MFLITGATGTIGRHLVELLVADGAKVRAVSRDPDAAGLPAGVEVVAGDPSRPETLGSALDGVTGLYLHSRAAGEAAELAALAKERGVTKVVVQSALNIDDPLDHQPSRFNGDRNREAEEAAVGSGLEWVSVRPGWFAGNALRAFGRQIRAGDVVAGPYANFAESPIHERDIAAVAARALLTDELVGRRLAITGPESLTHEEMIEVIGRVIGLPLRYQEVPPQAAAQGLVQAGFSEEAVAALLARYAREVGQPAPVTGVVAEVLGRPAHSFAEWVADNADAFRREPDGKDAR